MAINNNNSNFKLLIISMVSVLFFSVVAPSLSSAKSFENEQNLRNFVVQGETDQYLNSLTESIEADVKKEMGSKKVDVEILNITETEQNLLKIDSVVSNPEGVNKVSLEIDLETQSVTIEGKAVANNQIEEFYADGKLDKENHAIKVYDKKHGKKQFELNSYKANASIAPVVLVIIRAALQVGKQVL